MMGARWASGRRRRRAVAIAATEPLALIALAVFAATGCRPPDDGSVVRLDRMELRPGEAPEPDRPPGRSAGGWRPVSMPDHWDLRRRARATSGWYRSEVMLPDDIAPSIAGDSVAIYVPGHSGRLEVDWDGELLGDSQPVSDTPPHVSGPLLLLVPASRASPGPHVLQLHLQGTATMVDYLREPYVGARSVLQPVFDAKRLTSRDVPLALAAAGIAVALVLFVAYWPGLQGSTWLALGLLTWSLSVVGLFQPFPLLPVRLFEPLRPALYQWSFAAFAIAIHRLRGLDRPRIERSLFGVWSLFSILIFVVPPLYIYAVAVIWTIPSAVVGLYVVGLLVGFARGAERARAALVLVPVAVVALLVVHDLTGVATHGRLVADQLLSIYAAPAVMLGLVGLFVLGARETLIESRRLNRELEERVASKGRELESNYRKLREAERGRAVAAERERILRDMHDGLGGQLVSTLAMVESGSFERDELAEALRDSLDDLRLMVESLDPAEADLLSTLAVVRERLEPRLARHGLRFEWNVEDLPDLPHLGHGDMLHVLRIVQEALGNILKHAKASTITLETGTAAIGDSGDACVFLRIRDDGVGLPDGAAAIGSEAAGGEPDGRTVGRGLRHMRERARQIGGRLEIDSRRGPGEGSDRSGTTLTLVLPLPG